MDIIEFREYCLQLPMTVETTPFDPETLVYKVAGKVYALGKMVNFHYINVKCDPTRAIEQRERYQEITPGWHMNKTHWNSIVIDGDLPERLVQQLIYDSYLLVVNSLPRHEREQILSLQHTHE